MTVKEAAATQEQAAFGARLNNAVRENPLAAGLVGLGVLWMLVGGERLGSVAASVSSTGGDAVSSTSKRVLGAVSSAGGAASETAKDIAAAVAESVTQVGESASTGNGGARSAKNSPRKDAKREASDFYQETAKAAQRNLTNTAEKQPLLLGVVGLGIGAGIASMFSATDLERELMGESGGVVKDRISALVSSAEGRAEKVAAELKEEAKNQGLTPDSAVAAISSIAGKVNAVAGEAKQSILAQ